MLTHCSISTIFQEIRTSTFSNWRLLKWRGVATRGRSESKEIRREADKAWQTRAGEGQLYPLWTPIRLFRPRLEMNSCLSSSSTTKQEEFSWEPSGRVLSFSSTPLRRLEFSPISSLFKRSQTNPSTWLSETIIKWAETRAILFLRALRRVHRQVET